ncbi:MAG: DUF72 domain-containing protein [Candidatus Thermoplasmatota archaeon]|jgi:uncharacterized protein YecE (DUF72 family)|nr:DUF72 domain-containing protein [Candidatus Thermoplasmatota archaeon]
MNYIGCSGWSYRDWEKVFYPSGEKDKLAFYSSIFNSVEINSTFYNTPSIDAVSSWTRTVKSIPNFRFTIKLPKELTHDLILHNEKGAVSYLKAYERLFIEEFFKKERLGALLLQLPPFLGADKLESLYRILSNLDTGRYRYAVEIRNRELFIDPSISRRLSDLNIALVDIDSPDLGIGSLVSKADFAYIRLHGRNVEAWNRINDYAMEKYRYDYGKEITQLSGYVQQLQDSYTDLYVYFNNHPDGNAPRNAISLIENLKGDRSQGSSGLFSFK